MTLRALLFLLAFLPSFAVAPAPTVESQAAAYIQVINRELSEREALELAGYFVRASAEQQVPLADLLAIAKTESAFRKHARSWAGAHGLMQIMPYWGDPEELADPERNVLLGAKIWAHFKLKCGSRVAACYHGGLGAYYNPKLSTLYYVNSIELTRKQVKRYIA